MRFASWKRQICYSTSQKCKWLDFSQCQTSLVQLLGQEFSSLMSFINHRTNITRLLKVLHYLWSRLFLSHCVLQSQCVCVQHYFTPSAENMTHVIRVCAGLCRTCRKCCRRPSRPRSPLTPRTDTPPQGCHNNVLEPCAAPRALVALGLSSARLPARMRDRGLVEVPSQPNPAAAT